MQLAASACKVCMRLAAVAYKLYPSDRQSHINCTRVAASHMQIVPAWPPVACNMNKIGRNLHATGGPAGTICMQLAATRVQFACDWWPLGYKTRDSRQEVCKRPSLHHNYSFLALAIPHPRPYFWFFSRRLLDIWFGKCAGTMDGKATWKQILHPLAASACKSASFLQARCENNYLNKKMKTPLKNLIIYATQVLNKCYPSTLCVAWSNLIRRYL
jgi:hypothetical protein